MPEERIAVRIRRARLRRAAGAGVLAVAAVAGAISGVVLAHQPAPGHAASYSAPPLPASFTASDGTTYRRLAITPVTGPNQVPGEQPRAAADLDDKPATLPDRLEKREHAGRDPVRVETEALMVDPSQVRFEVGRLRHHRMMPRRVGIRLARRAGRSPRPRHRRALSRRPPRRWRR